MTDYVRIWNDHLGEWWDDGRLRGGSHVGDAGLYSRDEADRYLRHVPADVARAVPVDPEVDLFLSFVARNSGRR